MGSAFGDAYYAIVANATFADLLDNLNDLLLSVNIINNPKTLIC